jgi:predicted peroxiredoxin
VVSDAPAKVPLVCKFADVKEARPQSLDPTAFEDDPAIILAPGRHNVLEDVVVTLRHGERVLARLDVGTLEKAGMVARLLPPAGQDRITVPAGKAVVTVTGRRVANCPHRAVDHRGNWRFTEPTLPVRAAPATTFVEDARASGVRLYVRSVAGRLVRGVRAALLDAKGKVVGAAKLDAAVRDGAILDVGVPAGLQPGSYRVRFTGRPEGASAQQVWTTPLVLGTRGTPGSPPVDADAGLSEQHVVVDWSDNKAAGRDTAGFVAPGIGYGELVCGYDQQHIRFHPNDLTREQSMMLWTYKDWSEDNEKSIRESIHTQFSGPDFQEGLNKFSPPEHKMTGEYEGLISDRGPLDAPFGTSLAPPTSILLTWVWRFGTNGKDRCHVEATLRTENGNPTPSRPLARSAQIVWRGDDNAPGHDAAGVDVPGVGTVSLSCQASPTGVRTITVDPATEGGAVFTREGGDDHEADYDHGPLVVQLPNNGQVKFGLFGGASILVSSRWKVNDTIASQNSCRVAAQVVAE